MYTLKRIISSVDFMSKWVKQSQVTEKCLVRSSNVVSAKLLTTCGGGATSFYARMEVLQVGWG